MARHGGGIGPAPLGQGAVMVFLVRRARFGLGVAKKQQTAHDLQILHDPKPP
jgi:hypothetical protein